MNSHTTSEAAARAWRSKEAARLFYDNAETIALACAAADWWKIVVATVRPDLVFGGTETLLLARLIEHARLREGQGWTLLCKPQLSAAEIQRVALKLAISATRRWEILQRRANGSVTSSNQHDFQHQQPDCQTDRAALAAPEPRERRRSALSLWSRVCAQWRRVWRQRPRAWPLRPSGARAHATRRQSADAAGACVHGRGGDAPQVAIR